jgi:magnesium transporter
MATGSKPAALFKRASWLVILFVGEMLTATAMGYFEAEISRPSCWRYSFR